MLYSGKRQKAQYTKYNIQNTHHGFSLVEVILATSLFALLVTIFIGAYLYGQESTALAGNRARAVMLASEGIEAVRNIRDENFTNLVDGTYGLAVSGGQLVLSGSSDITDIFTRSVTISTVDSDRKSVTSNVSWAQNAQRNGQVSLASRLTYWMRVVAAGWSNPVQVGTLDLSGGNDAVKVQISGNYAYFIRSGGTDFDVVDISNPSSPTSVAALNLNGTLSNIFISGNYAYVTSNDNSSELIIVNIATPTSPAVIGTFNNSGNSNGVGVYVSGTTAYLGLDGGNELSIVNVSNPASPTLISSLNLAGDATEIVKSGNYLFIASNANSNEVIVVDATTPASPSVATSIDLSSNTDATSIAVSGDTLLVSQGNLVYLIDVSSPTSPSILASYDALDTVNDIALDFAESGDYMFIATSENSTEFQVVDISTPASPVLLSSVDTLGNSNLQGIAYDSVNDIAVAAGADNNEEVLVFAPQ